MKSLVVLLFLAQTVFGYSIESFSSNEELSPEAIKEIQQLIEFTKKVDESQAPVPKLLQGPLKISERDIGFYVFRRNDRQGKKISIPEISEITSLTAFDPNLDTVFCIHGWQNNYNSSFINIVASALFEIKDVNIISVDWDRFTKFSYFTAFLSVGSVGQIVGEFIQKFSETFNYPLDRISLIGHSLGAHVCGYAGRSSGGLVSSITGLDPAGPLYFQAVTNTRLHTDDAQYVQVIHTDGMFLGMSYPIGDIDFWPNGGYNQPGCPVSFGMCSHSRSYEYFGESLTSNNFISTECNSFSVYEAGKCRNNTITTMGGPSYNKTLTGDFYLFTNTTSPYALGYVNLTMHNR